MVHVHTEKDEERQIAHLTTLLIGKTVCRWSERKGAKNERKNNWIYIHYISLFVARSNITRR